MKKSLISGLAIGALTLAGGTAQAVQNFHLIAKEVTITYAGDPVTMWAFAEDVGGACYSITSGGQNSPASKSLRNGSSACQNPDSTAGDAEFTVPGPELKLGAGDPDVRVRVTNLLPEPISIVVPGQEMPYTINNNGPTWVNGQVGPGMGGLPGTRRVRSFGREAPAIGGRLQYRWTNFYTNPFQVGSYIYHSGTHPQVQVQMGLYGAVNRDQAAGVAYTGVPYANQVSLFYSEIDPVLHADVAAGTYGTTGLTSTIDYQPKLFLVNGKVFTAKPDTTIGVPVGTSPTLVRAHNMGLETHNPVFDGLRIAIVAEDGNPYLDPRLQYSALLPAGKTKDIIIADPLASGESHAVYDGMLALGNGASATGGMLAFLEGGFVVPAGTGLGLNEAPVAHADNAGTAINTPVTFSLTANDVDSDGSIDVTTVVIKKDPTDGTVLVNVDGSVTYTPNPDFTGWDVIRYRVMDNAGKYSLNPQGTNKTKVTIKVLP